MFEYIKSIFSKKDKNKKNTEKIINNNIVSISGIKKEENNTIEDNLDKGIILIDNGHGEDTCGKRSPYCTCGISPKIEFYEWKWNREIANLIFEKLTSLKYDVRIIVPEDKDITLKKRVERVNKICNENEGKNIILLSIHSNACGNGKNWMKAQGWSAYTTKGVTKSDLLAEKLYDAAKKYLKGKTIRTDCSDGDSDIEENFYIIKNTKCPAVLTENFFYDNAYDVQFILSNEGKEKIVNTHIEGIINYLNE